jgi:Protein of unknown function (DUF935)
MVAKVIHAEDAFSTPQLDTESGSALGWWDRLFIGYRDGKIFDYSDWTARDLASMMRKPGKHKQIEAVITYPTVAAERSIIPGGLNAKLSAGDKAAALDTSSTSPDDSGTNEVVSWLREFWTLDEFSGGCETDLNLVIDQMTSAATYKKSFHEIEWTTGIGDYEGQIVPKGIYWRPQTTTRLLRDPKRNAKPWGLEQDKIYLGNMIGNYTDKDSKTPFIEIPLQRSLIHIHGARRDPINGLSDLEVPYWAYKTQQKVLFLWLQFAEGVSLPRAVVKAQDVDTAKQVAQSIVQAKGSGVIPVGIDGRADAVSVDVLDMSGKGGDSFQSIITWLDQTSVDSVLAGFLNLTSNTSGGGYALSSDASDFFLMTLESKNREIERDIRRGLFAPMTRYNFGPRVSVPALKFEPLNAEDKTAAVNMLQGLMAGRDPSIIPDEFLGALAGQVANYLGMNGAAVEKAFQGSAAKAAAAAAQQNAAFASVPGQQLAQVAGGVNAAAQTVAQAVRTPSSASSAPVTPRKAIPAQKPTPPDAPQRPAKPTSTKPPKASKA